MKINEILLIDFGSIGFPIWAQNANDPNPDMTSRKIIERVRALATLHPHAAVCCDSGPSFRKELSPEYKANRPDKDAALLHQYRLAQQQLEQDGFPIWSARGFEADDIIATATLRALTSTPPMTVLIASADKDLLQLVSPTVRVKSVNNDTLYDENEVIKKFNVRPDQVRDFLTLVGDTSDNVKGARGIGAKRAAELLARFNSLEQLYAEMTELGAGGLGLPPAITLAIQEFREQWPKTAELITLRFDVPISFEEITAVRVEKAIADHGTVMDAAAFEDDGLDAAIAPLEEAPAAVVTPEPVAASPVQAPPTPTPAPPVVPPPTRPVEAVQTVKETPLAPKSAPPATPPPSQALARRKPVEAELVTTDYERQLDPRSLPQAVALAATMFQSKMFTGYGNDAAVLSTIMLGRELGIPAMGSLRQIHIIEGKHSLSAQLMVALVMRSGQAEYFEPVSFSLEEATFVTKRKGARNEVTLQYTVKHAQLAGLVKKDSNWEKRPEEMCIARAQARLCRLVYPDIIGGLYTPDELSELLEKAA